MVVLPPFSGVLPRNEGGYIMDLIDADEAMTEFSQLMERVEAGEEFIIGRAGRPIARLVPYRATGLPRTPGAWAGRVEIAHDFDTLPDEILKAFHGDAI